MRIAIQGELGCFSHQAAIRMLPRARIKPCVTSPDVFAALTRGTVEAAVIPIENSLAGSVTEHLDLLLANDVWVERESLLRIEHNLIARRGVKISDLREVLSHPVALAQCRDFLAQHPRLQPVPFYDTAGAVKHIVWAESRESAAIAGRHAAQVYGARILRAGIEDDKKNFTRFFLVRRRRRKVTGADKTSVAFAVKNVAGALFKALSVFALRDISLSRIESRPVRGAPWQYVFFVDLLRGDDPPARNALLHLREVCQFVKVLGIYRSAR